MELWGGGEVRGGADDRGARVTGAPARGHAHELCDGISLCGSKTVSGQKKLHKSNQRPKVSQTFTVKKIN